MDRYFRTMVYILALIILLSGYGSPVLAEETSPDAPFSDKLMIRGGWAYVFGATANASVAGPVLGLGAAVDFTNTLGGNSSTDAFRIDGLYRFNDRHAVGVSWYRVGLSGNKALTQDIQIGDNAVSAGATTQTGLSFNTYRLLYNYSFYRTDKAELAFSPGLYMMKTNFNFAAQGTINGVTRNTALVNEQITLPLPSVGLVANYDITKKLQFQSRFDFFYLSINSYSGSMFEFYGGLEYRLFKHFAMGAAYDRLIAGLRGDGDKGFTVNFSYNLAYVYATLYAF
ncbi:conserved protein of unknown function [Nitrospira japonica]|uniref:Outer membrane protein beta-barrel domain-containing protein n=1 Tax=Nitrospira japonica TaxID=1325564 RepID=A0A1W1I7L5_9BACT|nr:DUF481 domain-containing protein [Nitrospira japonica]SLM49038.1 conserved protein of unknown function [Nitrospira japonica]